MKKNKVRISIIDMDLLSVSYSIQKENKQEKSILDIKYEIFENDSVQFYIIFSFTDKDIILEAKYKLVVKIQNVDKINEFLTENKEEIIYPVYMKMSYLISFLTDQSFPFPKVTSPYIWFDEEEE